MPLWPLDQLEDCLRQKSSGNTDDKLLTLRGNYELIGGIVQWALGEKENVEDQVSSAVGGVNFEALQFVMATQHTSKSDNKELVHRKVSWSTPLDEDGKRI
jgi:hypothetical protein